MSLFDRNKYAIAATAGVLGALGVTMVLLRWRGLRNGNLLSKQNIEVVETVAQCEKALGALRRGCKKYRVLGFDCEWVTINGRRHPVALLQLASQDGYCALFRLNKMKNISTGLKEILENDKILKVGVSPFDDAHNLFKDYNVCVNGTLDLRHLAVQAQEAPEGLANMSLKHLNIKLDKDWRLRCSNWEAPELTDRQIKYAACDAFVAVEIYNKFICKILKTKYNIHIKPEVISNDVWDKILNECDAFFNIRYKQKCYDSNTNIRSNKVRKGIPFDQLISDEQKRSMNFPNLKQPKRGFVSRSKPLYENCYMQNPQGHVLSTCDGKKAKWYVERGLADYVCEDPLTIRLNFKPSGDVSGDVDKYYQIPRENKCVVCGHDDSYIRKNVIPREYRKLFPVVMKTHSSHDVLLLCNNCHQISNNRDLVLRNKLSVQCDAPLDSSQAVVVHRSLQKVASAAKALLEASKSHNIPASRREELEKTVKEYFSTDDITQEMLSDACKLKYVRENPLYESHGKKVVDYFSSVPGGLLQLEEIWRQHFLDTMRPKYMPELWSVNHNKERLEIRAVEGRLNEEVMTMSGFVIQDVSTASEPLKSL